MFAEPNASTRRDWIASLALAAVPCERPQLEQIAFRDLPESAVRFARELGLEEDRWAATLAQHRQELEGRVSKGSAEHITYYVLQSRSFTDRPPLDPARIAASRPVEMPAEVRDRFQNFLNSPPAQDRRYQIVRNLFRSLGPDWSPEKCFAHTMQFLTGRMRAGGDHAAVDKLYQKRGLSTDTAPAQTHVLERAESYLGDRIRRGPVLLIGPGLDLTRRQQFSDDLPLKSYQAEWLARTVDRRLECMDIRPDVIQFLRESDTCAFRADVTQDLSARSRYDAAFATNVFLYLSEQLLFLALAVLALALRPGGYLVHNDSRFAAKIFGEALGLPIVHFEPISLGFRGEVEQMDRVVIHRRTIAVGA